MESRLQPDASADTGKAETQWEYHPQRGYLTKKTYADQKKTQYTYKPSGRLATRVWARGLTTTYGYDGAGRIESVGYFDSTASVGYNYTRAWAGG